MSHHLLPRVIAVTLLLAVSTCAAGDPPTNTATGALVRAYLEVWNGGDPAALDRVVSDDFRRGDWNGPVTSRAGLKTRIRQARRDIAGLQLELHDLVVAGDRAAARLTRHGTWRATGAVLEIPVHSIFRVADGRLVSEEPMHDHVAFLEALGMRVTLPGEEIVPPPVGGPPPPGVDLAASAAALDRAVSALAPRSGRGGPPVTVVSRNVARLLVDGRELGITRPDQRLELPLAPGTHTVALRSLAGLPLDGRRLEVPRRGEPMVITLGSNAPLAVHLRDGITEDLRSGLTWTLRDNGEDVEWQQAMTYCDDLEHAGHDDWRLPDIRELLPLYDPASEKDWKTLPGIELSSCCPWSRNRYRDAMAWFFVSYKGSAAVRYHPFKRYQRALCVRVPAP